MPTINQLCRFEGSNRGRKKFKRKLDSALQGSPQKRGTCILIKTATPRKPNSACRRVARVRLSNGKEITAYIPGIGHNLQTHAEVLVRGVGPRDLPAVNHSIIRGKDAAEGVVGRKTSRSKYGVKK